MTNETSMKTPKGAGSVESKKKEFEKFAEENDMIYVPTCDYGITNNDIDKLWNWIITNFQPKDEQNL